MIDIYTKDSEWGGSGMTFEAWEWIRSKYPDDSTIIELGGGRISTPRLLTYYNLYTIENSISWYNELKVNNPKLKVLHAPVVGNWYTNKDFESFLPINSSLIIVDGPATSPEVNRLGFIDNYKYFDPNADIMVDDVWRDAEMNLAKELSKHTGKKMTIAKTGQYAVLES